MVSQQSNRMRFEGDERRQESTPDLRPAPPPNKKKRSQFSSSNHIRMLAIVPDDLGSCSIETGLLQEIEDRFQLASITSRLNKTKQICLEFVYLNLGS